MAFGKLELSDEDFQYGGKFGILTDDDFAKEGEVHGPNPDLINYSPLETGLIGAGEGFTRAYQGVKDLGLAAGELLGIPGAKERRNELAEQIREERRLFNQNIGSDQNPNRKYLTAGQVGANVALGVPLPFMRGKTIAQTMLKNAPIAALYESIVTPGNAEERLKAGASGATGAALGIGALGAAGKGYEVIKPRLSGLYDDLVNRTAEYLGGRGPLVKPMKSRWTDPSAIDKNALGESIGAPVSIGDIKGGGPVRMVEQGFANESQRGPILREQVSALEDAIGVSKNHMADAIDNTSKNLAELGNEIFEPVHKKIKNATILIDPVNMHTSARDLKDNFSQLFEDSYYDASRLKEFNDWLDNPYPLDYNEFRNFQQILGKASRRAKDLANRGDIEQGAVTRSNGAYSDSYKDLDAWGQTGSSSTRKKYADIIKTHKQAMENWKRDVLPFDNEVTAALRAADTPEKTASIILNPKNKSTLEKVINPELKKYSPEGSHIYDVVRLLNRAGESMSHGIDPASTHPSDIINPMLTGVRKVMSNITTDPLAKDLYFGKFDHIMPGGDGVLAEIARRIPVSYMRDNEDFNTALMEYLIKSAMYNEEGKSMGSITEDTSRNISNIK